MSHVASSENPQHPYADPNNQIETVSRDAKNKNGRAPNAQEIMYIITGLPKDQQQAKLNELAELYGVDLKKVMGINVAFDITDNTDDIEPTKATMKTGTNTASEDVSSGFVHQINKEILKKPKKSQPSVVQSTPAAAVPSTTESAVTRHRKREKVPKDTRDFLQQTTNDVAL